MDHLRKTCACAACVAFAKIRKECLQCQVQKHWLQLHLATQRLEERRKMVEDRGGLYVRLLGACNVHGLLSEGKEVLVSGDRQHEAQVSSFIRHVYIV